MDGEPKADRFNISDDEETPTLAQIQREYIAFVLKRQGGNKSSAARVLDVNRRSIYRMFEDGHKAKIRGPSEPIVDL